ncbi:hypothetical protein [Amycolatopsis sp. NPDC051061]|uniref:hypothetical protein n=1 Tax=Amycolatopsis sp. NPDC051061 TaxID=3155042 RepID=UPI003439FF47
MIVRAVTCPHPPLLLPGVTGGPVPEVEELRTACRAAVEDLAGADVVVAVGGAPSTRVWPVEALSPRHLFAPGTEPLPPGEVLPLSLAVARELLGAVPVELHGVDAALPVEDCRGYGRRLAVRPERIGLLIMADGSARRGPKAPGYEDPRALDLDGVLEDALRAGDPEPFLKLEPELADDLLVGGRAAWQVLSGAWEGRATRAKCHYSADPFGVWYPVFTWTPA